MIIAPNGIVGLVQQYIQHAGGQVGRRKIEADAGTRAMSQLLEIERLGKRFGGFVALDGISLVSAAGERSA